MHYTNLRLLYFTYTVRKLSVLLAERYYATFGLWHGPSVRPSVVHRLSVICL